MIMAPISIVASLIGEYTGYRKDKRKSDDLVVRKRLSTEIDKSKDHIKNIIDFLYEQKKNEDVASVKKVKDELDVFSSEVQLSLTGHKYPFFSIQKGRSPRESDLKKLIKYDQNMLENIVNVTEASAKIEDMVIDNSDLSIAREFAKMRQYVTKSRGTYKDREEFLKRWK